MRFDRIRLERIRLERGWLERGWVERIGVQLIGRIVRVGADQLAGACLAQSWRGALVRKLRYRRR